MKKLKSLNNDEARRLRVRAVVAYPAVSVALVVAISLALTPFGTSQVMALPATTPLETTAPTATATVTSSPSPTSSLSPSPTTSPAPSEIASTSATTTTTPGATPSPAPIPSASSAVSPLDHHVLARIEGRRLQANYLPVDEPVTDATRFQTFRVRFRLRNTEADPVTTLPRLEFRPEAGGAYGVVPEKPVLGVPLHVDREWVPSLGLGGGTMASELGEDIVLADLRIGDESGLPVRGHRSMGANPDQPITLPPGSYTEQEFTVTLSIDAEYLTGYELRVTDGGRPLTGTDVAVIRLGATPATALSPGQRQGLDVADPAPASSSAGAAYPLLSANSVVANTASVPAAPVVSGPSAVGYPLIAGTPSAATDGPSAIHGPYSMTTDKCATCHGSHTTKSPNLLVEGSQTGLCLTCHGAAGGASTNVDDGYTDPSLPDNVPGEREYFSHDVKAPTPHTRSELDEFGGQTNRHTSCADCHNPHKATSSTDGSTDSTQTLTGWTASGRLAGLSGVSVVNGAPGSAPTYTFRSGATDVVNEDDPVTDTRPIDLEYQVCFKCHSGFTKLLPNNPLKPSRDALDKGVEFNPANESFHPVEAQGKNGTTAMQASLDGVSPYKLWNFNTTSTIRCLNCHASGTTAGPNPPVPEPPVTEPLPLPGSSLSAHTSTNRGILLRPYRDRVLKSTAEAYSAKDFALCYVCHGEAPFRSSSSTATNFPVHSLHISQLQGGSGGTDIDSLGAGEGLAICAECHFRTHSTTTKVGAPGGSRLVNFAPNVKPLTVGGTPTWTPPGATSAGSCALTCHGETHNPYGYG